jgi:WD40 repeat protein/serine/threonine protein kinase
LIEREIFDAALDIADPEVRSAYLDQNCGGNVTLRRHIEALLKAHGTLENFLAGPAPELLTRLDEISVATAEGRGTVIGPYQLQQQIGEGGMGIVYLAEQLTPVRRKVALKIIKPGMDTRQVIARFEAERQALALMDHPHIARVLDAATTASGRPYFVMELVQGTPITDYCDEHNLPVPDRLRLFVAVCRAVQHAHQKGIIHRDLKPSNVLATEHDGLPVPKVIDFGVAKAIDQDLYDKTHFTRSDQMIGTPLYMSPEQAGGADQGIDTRTDIYSLGVLLYELLTGTTPFDKDRLRRANGDEIRRIICEEEPIAPSTRISTLPADRRNTIIARCQVDARRLSQILRDDLDWIVAKALEKDRSRRYATANDFAADVLRYLNHEPVEAGPPSAVYRFGKFARRNRLAIITISVVAASLLVGICTSTWLAISATRARDDANLSKQRADEALAGESQQRAAAVARQVEAEEARAAADSARQEAERTLTDMYTEAGLVAGDRQEPAQAVLWFANAALRAGTDEARAQANRIRVRTWGREVPMPVLGVPQSGKPVSSIALHLQLPYLMITTADGRSALWGLDPQAEISLSLDDRRGRCAAWSPDGQRLVLACRQDGDSDPHVELFSFPEGKLLHRLEHSGPISTLVFSRDGSRLAIAGTQVRVWDFQRQEFVTPLWPHPKPVACLTFNSRGDQLATGCADGFVRIFAVAEDPTVAAPLFPPLPNLGPWDQAGNVVDPVFIDHDRGLLTADGARPVRWWNTVDGQQVRQIPIGFNVCRIRSSPDGKCFVVCGDSRAQLWDVASASPIGQSMPQDSHAYDAAFSSDGRTLLTVCHHAARLWSVPSGNLLTAAISHPGDVKLAAFSGNGQYIATAQTDGLVRAWRVPRGKPGDRRIAVADGKSFARLSPDGRQLITAGMKLDWIPATVRSASLHDVASGEPIGHGLNVAGPLIDAAISPDGLQAVTVAATASGPDNATGGAGGELRFWNTETGQPEFDAVSLPARPSSVTYSPDGQSVAANCRGGTIVLIDPRQGGQVRCRWRWTGAPISNLTPGVTFTPDSQSFLTWGIDHNLRVWQTATGDPRYAPLQHEHDCTDATASADSRFLASASRDKTVRIWDAATGECVGGPLRHPDFVFRVRFSPDGRHVLTGGDDAMARLWDWRTGRLVCPPFRHSAGVYGAGFSPDGRWILTASWDKTARLWEWCTGKSLSPPWSLEGVGSVVDIAPDGSHAAVSGWMSTIYIFNLDDLVEPDKLDADDLVAWGEIISGYQVLDGGLNGLTTEEWLERWERIRHRLPASQAPE